MRFGKGITIWLIGSTTISPMPRITETRATPHRFFSGLIFLASFVAALAVSAWIIAYSYHLNFAVFFYDGLLALLALLLILKLRFPKNIPIQTSKTT